MLNSNLIRSTLRRVALGAAGALMLAGCGSLTSEGSSINPSYLYYSGKIGTLTVPDTVAHGALFPVKIQTVGGGCTQQSAGNEVRTDGQTVEIRPTDRTEVHEGCSTDLIYIEHTLNVTAPAAGVATIKVIGVTDTPDASATSYEYSIQKTVIVR